MTGGGGLTKDNARQVQAGFEMSQSGDDGRGRARHLGAVETEQDRTGKGAGQFRRGAASLHVHAVKQSPVAFQQSHVRRREGGGRGGLSFLVRETVPCAIGKEQAQLFGGQEKGIKVTGRAARCLRQPGRIDIIRAFLEGLYPQTGFPPATAQPQRQEGLAAAAGNGGNAEAGRRDGQCRYMRRTGEGWRRGVLLH